MTDVVHLTKHSFEIWYNKKSRGKESGIIIPQCHTDPGSFSFF